MPPEPSWGVVVHVGEALVVLERLRPPVAVVVRHVAVVVDADLVEVLGVHVWLLGVHALVDSLLDHTDGDVAKWQQYLDVLVGSLVVDAELDVVRVVADDHAWVASTR